MYLGRIASGGWDKRLLLWDIQTGTILVSLANFRIEAQNYKMADPRAGVGLCSSNAGGPWATYF